MKTADMVARIQLMNRELRIRVKRMIIDGYSAHAIARESDATLKQANAMFELMRRENKGQYHTIPYTAPTLDLNAAASVVGIAADRDYSTHRKPPIRARRRPLKVFPKPHLRDDGGFLLPKPLAYSRITDQAGDVGGVRVFRLTPDYIALQIRTTGRVGESRSSKPRTAYSQVSLDAGDVQAVIDELQRLLPEVVK